jgi:hypothetical protein
LKLATSPSFTGSLPITKTIEVVVVAPLAASAETVSPVAAIHGHLAMHKIGRKQC